MLVMLPVFGTFVSIAQSSALVIKSQFSQSVFILSGCRHASIIVLVDVLVVLTPPASHSNSSPLLQEYQTKYSYDLSNNYTNIPSDRLGALALALPPLAMNCPFPLPPLSHGVNSLTNSFRPVIFVQALRLLASLRVRLIS